MEVRGKIYACCMPQRGSVSWGGGRVKRGVGVGQMKRIADNPHDEHLGAEIAEQQEEDGEIFSS